MVGVKSRNCNKGGCYRASEIENLKDDLSCDR